MSLCQGELWPRGNLSLGTRKEKLHLRVTYKCFFLFSIGYQSH